MNTKTLWISVALAGLALPASVLAAGMGGHHGFGNSADAAVTRAEVEAKVKERFAAADVNKDGYVTEAEVQARRTSMMAERRDAHFKAMDKDGNGAITRAEFDAAASARPMGEGRAMSRAGKGGEGRGMRGRHGGRGGMGAQGLGMIRQGDKDGDGRVSLAEALARPLERFDAADSDKNGVMSADERRAAFQQRAAGRGSKGE